MSQAERGKFTITENSAIGTPALRTGTETTSMETYPTEEERSSVDHFEAVSSGRFVEEVEDTKNEKTDIDLPGILKSWNNDIALAGSYLYQNTDPEGSEWSDKCDCPEDEQWEEVSVSHKKDCQETEQNSTVVRNLKTNQETDQNQLVTNHSKLENDFPTKELRNRMGDKISIELSSQDSVAPRYREHFNDAGRCVFVTKGKVATIPSDNLQEQEQYIHLDCQGSINSHSFDLQTQHHLNRHTDNGNTFPDCLVSSNRQLQEFQIENIEKGSLCTKYNAPEELKRPSSSEFAHNLLSEEINPYCGSSSTQPQQLLDNNSKAPSEELARFNESGVANWISLADEITPNHIAARELACNLSVTQNENLHVTSGDNEKIDTAPGDNTIISTTHTGIPVISTPSGDISATSEDTQPGRNEPNRGHLHLTRKCLHGHPCSGFMLPTVRSVMNQQRRSTKRKQPTHGSHT